MEGIKSFTVKRTYRNLCLMTATMAHNDPQHHFDFDGAMQQDSPLGFDAWMGSLPPISDEPKSGGLAQSYYGAPSMGGSSTTTLLDSGRVATNMIAGSFGGQSISDDSSPESCRIVHRSPRSSLAVESCTSPLRVQVLFLYKTISEFCYRGCDLTQVNYGAGPVEVEIPEDVILDILREMPERPRGFLGDLQLRLDDPSSSTSARQVHEVCDRVKEVDVWFPTLSIYSITVE